MAGANIPIRFTAEPVRSLAFGSISGTYAGVGSAVNNPIRQFFIQNLTDKAMMFSFDGVNDHFPLPANGFFLDDVSSNTALAAGFFLPQGGRLYVKELSAGPTTGSVYFSVFYGSV